MDYSILKLLHISFAIISISGFIARYLLSLYHASLLHKNWLKVAPHINDTLLLITAIALTIQTGYSPLQHGWLASKIMLLIVYIGMGAMTLRFARKPRTRLFFFMLAILTFIGIILLAVNKPVTLF